MTILKIIFLCNAINSVAFTSLFDIKAEKKKPAEEFLSKAESYLKKAHKSFKKESAYRKVVFDRYIKMLEKLKSSVDNLKISKILIDKNVRARYDNEYGNKIQNLIDEFKKYNYSDVIKLIEKFEKLITDYNQYFIQQANIITT